MALGTVSVCLTVVVLNLHHRDIERPVPKWAKVLVLSYLSKLLCVRARKPRTLANELAMYESGGPMNLRGGIRKIAKDVHILKPMLNKNNLDNDNRYSHGSDVFPTFTDDKPDVTHDWREVAHVMDRLFFWLVFIFMTASTFIIFLVPFYRDPKLQTWRQDQNAISGWIVPHRHNRRRRHPFVTSWIGICFCCHGTNGQERRCSH